MRTRAWSEKKVGKIPPPILSLSLSPFPRLRIPGPRSRALIRAITPAHVLPYVSALINTRDDGGRREKRRQTRQWGGNGTTANGHGNPGL